MTFIRTLYELAKKDPKIFLITPDLGFSVVEEFARDFPKQFLNVGIAEQNAVGIAAGLALSGRTVYVYSIIPFVTMRCFEQVRVDVAYMNTNVKLVGVGAGLGYGPAGATHHSIEDICLMRALPNMTVLCPGDPIEARELLLQSARTPGPMYLRVGKNGEPKLHAEDAKIEIGKAVELRKGTDITLAATSSLLESAVLLADRLGTEGISASVVSFHTLKPFDTAMARELASRKKPIFAIEEHGPVGGLGSAFAELIAESGVLVPYKRLGFPDLYTHHVGSQNYLRKKYGLDVEGLHASVKSSLRAWNA